MYAVRFDAVVVNADQSVEIHFTQGVPPLPATWQGQGFRFQTTQDVIDQLAGLEQRLSDDLGLILVAILAAVDGTVSQQAINKVEGKTLTLDLTAPANFIRLTG